MAQACWALPCLVDMSNCTCATSAVLCRAPCAVRSRRERLLVRCVLLLLGYAHGLTACVAPVVAAAAWESLALCLLACLHASKLCMRGGGGCCMMQREGLGQKECSARPSTIALVGCAGWLCFWGLGVGGCCAGLSKSVHALSAVHLLAAAVSLQRIVAYAPVSSHARWVVLVVVMAAASRVWLNCGPLCFRPNPTGASFPGCATHIMPGPIVCASSMFTAVK